MSMKQETGNIGGPRELFLCDRHNCKISPEACKARQERAHREACSSELSLSFERCFNCEQGKKMAAKIKDLEGFLEAETVSESVKEAVMDSASLDIPAEGQTKTELKHPCKECECREAVVSKKTGKPTHGLCRQCFGDKIRTAAQRRRDNNAEAYKGGNKEEAGAEERRDKALEAARAGKKEGARKPGDGKVITLDFSDHPDMLARVKADAEKQFRSVEQQIMWEINFASKTDDARVG